ncbi:MAG TPA: TonB family protein [Thermoanaerobaculia bacterium]|nr:TonB family protein [Thermoanaerobaculia bacterium]
MTRSRTPASSRLHGIAPPEGKDRRLLRLCFAAAVLLHGGLLFLPVPWTDAAAAPEPPPRVVPVERLRDLRPPEPPEPVPPDAPTETPEPRVPIPVPDDLVDEKPPLDDAPLPAPDLDTLAEIPVILPDGPPPPAPPAPDEPVHVLGPIVPPEAVFAPRPDYPEPARRTHRGGTVILLATIDEEGRVTDLEILRGGPLGLTEAALAAVRRWRFRPATLEDRPIAVYYHLTVRFETR